MGVIVRHKITGLLEASQRLNQVFDGNKRLELAERLAGFLESSTIGRFEKEESPEGNAWKATYRGGKILDFRGMLKNSIGSNATEEFVEVGSNLKYAAIHQYGGTIRAKAAKFLCFKHSGGFFKGKEVVISARPYLGISEQDKTRIYEIIGKFWDEALA